jgi:shikimate dehydrogenase
MVVSDLIYNPKETLFLRQARLAGAKTHNGLGMFIYQGAYALEYWTGLAAPTSVMRNAVVATL